MSCALKRHPNVVVLFRRYRFSDGRYVGEGGKVVLAMFGHKYLSAPERR